jgi:O-antigen/teichoic acid export membrane protein
MPPYLFCHSSKIRDNRALTPRPLAAPDALAEMRSFLFAFKPVTLIFMAVSDITLFGAGLGLAVLVVALAAWRERKPYQPGRLWVIPWRAVMALGLLAVLVLGAHLVSLLSGHPLAGRRGW